MKRAVLCVSLIFVGLSWAQLSFAQLSSGQQAPQAMPSAATPEGTIFTTSTFAMERVATPTNADLYCAGFIGKSEPRDRFVTGGLESPATANFGAGDVIYLHGHGYEAGQQLTIIREVRDPNRYELFRGQFAALKAAGHSYEELARVRVVDIRSRMAIAKIELSCDTVSPGDLAIPFVEKSTVAFHPPTHFDRYAPKNGQLTGRILLAQDFDTELGTGGKVYLNIGANQGLKVGDFLRAERSATALMQSQVDALSYNASTYDMNQQDPPLVNPTKLDRGHGPVIHTDEMPRRGVGEIVIIGTTPTTATGMIVFALEPVHVGDSVEVDQQ